jgi:hypothetical protein
MLKALRCRVFKHKWERIRGVEEEVYECRRCGSRRYGRLPLPGEVIPGQTLPPLP